MKKDLLIKRLYCAACALLSVYGIVKQWQNMLSGRGLSSNIILSGICLIAAGYYFFHPEKIRWKNVADAHRMSMIVWLTFGCGFLCLAYLFFGTKFGYPENWKMICTVTGMLSLGGYLMLTLENKKKD